jgi:membrane-associated phospholipid phosphatase
LITSAVPRPTIRALTLRILGGYVGLVTIVNIARMGLGTGSVSFLAAQLALVWAAWRAARGGERFWVVVGDWLPLIALPVLYWGLPWAMVGPGGRLFDGIVQRWDLALFGTEPARTMAGALPSRPLSELLHLAYLSYYAIIYGPVLLFYVSSGRRGFFETVLAFTVTMVLSFLAFSVFPVEGPRFAWSPPPGIPSGPIRSFTLMLLERGSARGTAFPSSHLAIALVQTLSSLRWRRSLGIVAGIATTMLAIGAVYGGFHYASDMAAGALVGAGAWLLSRGMERRAASNDVSGQATVGSS